MRIPLPQRAYDLEMAHRRVDRASAENRGWVFGLPPGIGPEQWPLDPHTGYPLMHGFTLLLPEDYRCHGPDIVALSFFATAAEHNDGGPSGEEEMVEAVLGVDPPSDPRYRPFWRAPDQRHPRLHRMKDILDCEYAVILLTQREFDGALCPPPEPPRVDLEMDRRQKKLYGEQGDDGVTHWVYGPVCPRPQWLKRGSAASNCVEGAFHNDIFGSAPAEGHEENRAILITPRARDENAGKAPRDTFGEAVAETGYRSFYYWEGGVIESENYREHDWAVGHKPNHIGGTMRPVQATPEMSPFYLGFEEYFGGYNFGTGNGQLDFLDMKIDWACG